MMVTGMKMGALTQTHLNTASITKYSDGKFARKDDVNYIENKIGDIVNRGSSV